MTMEVCLSSFESLNNIIMIGELNVKERINHILSKTISSETSEYLPNLYRLHVSLISVKSSVSFVLLKFYTI